MVNVLNAAAKNRRNGKPPEASTPALIPPVKNWDEDLPDLAEEQRYPPQLIRVNAINDVWMEIPRYVNYGWGGIWFVVIIFLIPLYIIISIFYEVGISSDLIFNGLTFL